jgi:hypothetical protein
MEEITCFFAHNKNHNPAAGDAGLNPQLPVEQGLADAQPCAGHGQVAAAYAGTENVS